MRWIGLAVLLVAATAWAYSPVPVQKSPAEIQLKASLDKAATDQDKARIATDFLNSKPTDLPAARVAQDVLLKSLDDAAAFFKGRADKSESVVDHYLYARASGDSTIMSEQAAWILKKDPKSTWGHMLAGLGEWEKQKPDNAVVEKHLKDAIAADPSRPESYLNIGYLYEDMDNWPAAREAFEAGAVVDPESVPMRDARITVYAMMRDADNYFKLLDPTLPKEPLTGTLDRALGTGSVDMTANLRGKTSVIEYWAFT